MGMQGEEYIADDLGNTGSNGGGADETYDSLTEREVAFKLIAAHALVDRDFYELLKSDPQAAVQSLHIFLEEDDIQYLKGGTDEQPGVEWERIDRYADEIRDAVHADSVVRSLW
jgi:hypothetical protein